MFNSLQIDVSGFGERPRRIVFQETPVLSNTVGVWGWTGSYLENLLPGFGRMHRQRSFCKIYLDSSGSTSLYLSQSLDGQGIQTFYSRRRSYITKVIRSWVGQNGVQVLPNSNQSLDTNFTEHIWPRSLRMAQVMACFR